MRYAKLFAAAARPAYWSAVTKGVLPTAEHEAPLSGIAPATVLDVGANKGQFSAFAHYKWPYATIHAFEPIPGQADRYARVMGNRATLHRCALGAEAGRMNLHLASRTDSSSLLPLGDEQKRLFNMTETAIIEVPVKRLDAELGGTQLDTPILLKIDVQGFEYEVLCGLGALAARIEWIYLEVSFVELYQGQKLFPAVEELLGAIGFCQVKEANVQLARDGKKIQSDMLFARTSPSHPRV